jgi:protein-tyrosine-phosphatase
MAEAFANHYGKDVLVASSAGLMPVASVDPRTVRVMEERGVDVSLHAPSLYDLRGRELDVVVNLSGAPIHRYQMESSPEMIEWHVRDPYNADLEFYREIRDEIERLVMLLILDLRRRLRAKAAG